MHAARRAGACTLHRERVRRPHQTCCMAMPDVRRALRSVGMGLAVVPIRDFGGTEAAFGHRKGYCISLTGQLMMAVPPHLRLVAGEGEVGLQVAQNQSAHGMHVCGIAS